MPEQKSIDTDKKKHIENMLEKLQTFLGKNKPADVLIIKAHLISDYYLNQVLILRDVCDGNKVFKMSFYEKTEKAFKKGSEDERKIKILLKKLNKLRNKVGHELEYILSEADIDALGYLVNGKKHILSKYKYEKEQLLRTVLVDIIIDLNILVFDLVMKEKKDSKRVGK